MIRDVTREHDLQVHLAEDDDVVEALSAHRPDQALRIRILPGARGRADYFCDAHAGHTTPERIAVNRVSVSHEPSRGGVIWEGFNDLLRRPFRGGMAGDRKVDDPSALVGKQHEDEEDAASDSRDREEVHRDERWRVIGEERAPGLARWPLSTTEESRDGALGDVDAELQEFSVDPRRSCPYQKLGTSCGDRAYGSWVITCGGMPQLHTLRRVGLRGIFLRHIIADLEISSSPELF